MKTLDVASMRLLDGWLGDGISIQIESSFALHGGGTRPVMTFISLDPEETIHPSSQPHEEVLLVLDGDLHLEVGNWCRRGSRGVAVTVPPMQPRSVHNPGPDPAYIVSILPEPTVMAAFVDPIEPDAVQAITPGVHAATAAD
jgi:quercetin dioxygenase-like cupin family protein